MQALGAKFKGFGYNPALTAGLECGAAFAQLSGKDALIRQLVAAEYSHMYGKGLVEPEFQKFVLLLSHGVSVEDSAVAPMAALKAVYAAILEAINSKVGI